MGAQKPTIVLVPGAWHYPETYDLLIERLHKHHYETRKVKLKSVITREERRAESHHEDAMAVRETIQPLIEQGKEVIVLGHSYGGIPVSEGSSGLAQKSTEAGGIVHLIYCCAFVLQEGGTVGGLYENPQLSAGLPQHFNALDDDGLTSYVLKEFAADTLYSDLDPELAQKAVDSLGVHSFKTILSPQEKCAWREIPSTYILCEQDKTILPFAQQYMIDQAGTMDVVKIDASHSPFLSKPDEMFDIIDKIARRDENAHT